MEKSAILKRFNLHHYDASCHGILRRVVRLLLLAARAIVATAPGNHEAFNRSLANQARLAFATVNAMPQLKETLLAIGIYIVGDARATQSNGFTQHSLQCAMQAAQFIAAQRSRATTWPNPGPEQGFVGIYIPHAAQQSLVQQRTLDWSLASAEESCEILETD